MDVRAQFGRSLKRARTANDLTQEELAFRAGLNVTYVSDLERGRNNPSLAVLVDLAAALGVHPSELLADLVISPRDPPTKRKRASQ